LNTVSYDVPEHESEHDWIRLSTPVFEIATADVFAVEFVTVHHSIALIDDPRTAPFLALQLNASRRMVVQSKFTIAMLLALDKTGRDESQSTAWSDVQSGLLGDSRLPELSQPCSHSGLATVGAPEVNTPDASDTVIVYVPGPMRHSSESEPLVKLKPVMTVDHAPAENSAARSAQVVPSAAPAPAVEKYRVTIATDHLTGAAARTAC
jgi:hypothetical protein